MIRTARSATLAALAAVTLVSIPGTAFADASGPIAGAGYNNGIVINYITQYGNGDSINPDDDDDVSILPGISAPFAHFTFVNMTYLPLDRTDQKGAQYPPHMPPGTRAPIATEAPSTADYRSIDSSGRVRIDATKQDSPTCTAEGSLYCRVEYTPSGVNLVVTPR